MKDMTAEQQDALLNAWLEATFALDVRMRSWFALVTSELARCLAELGPAPPATPAADDESSWFREQVRKLESVRVHFPPSPQADCNL